MRKKWLSVMKNLSDVHGIQLFSIFRRPVYSYVWMIFINANWALHLIKERENSSNSDIQLFLIFLCCFAVIALLIALAVHTRSQGGKAFLLQCNLQRTAKARVIEIILWAVVCLQVLVWSGGWEKVVWF